MLKLLEAEGFEPVGVETDSDMLELCRSQDLNVVEADATLWLQSLEPDTLDGIFCAQVIEHLPVSSLLSLVAAARRVLKRGAPMVLETIDPRSAFALGNWFYADLSHVRPVYPPTLAFLCESNGFSEVEILPRSPHPALQLLDGLPDDPTGHADQAAAGDRVRLPGLRGRRSKVTERPSAVHQFHAGTAEGDAVTQQMLSIRRRLRGLGYRSDVYALHIPPALSDQIRHLSTYQGSPNQVLLLYHSIGNEALEQLRRLPDRKILSYQNITPEEYFASEHVRRAVRLGRAQLKELPSIGRRRHRQLELLPARAPGRRLRAGRSVAGPDPVRPVRVGKGQTSSEP